MFRGLGQFSDFATSRFLQGKELTVTGVSPWHDYNTKEYLGLKVDTAITKDATKYTFKEGEAFTNLYEKLTLKVIGKKVDVSVGAIVEPVDAVGVIYGDYRNQLSIKCSDIKVLAAPKV